MNIKNKDYSAQQLKRERMVNYWQNQVIPNHLPPIDVKKRNEILSLKQTDQPRLNISKSMRPDLFSASGNPIMQEEQKKRSQTRLTLEEMASLEYPHQVKKVEPVASRNTVLIYKSSLDESGDIE